MTTYTLPLSKSTLHGYYSPDLAPALTVAPGERVACQTLAAGWNVLEHADPFTKPPKVPWRDPELDTGHALTGPIAVQGAQPGMALAVTFHTIRPGTWGWVSGGGYPAAWNDRLGLAEGEEHVIRWALEAESGEAVDPAGRRLPLRPFLGNFGLPPAAPGIHSTTRPRPNGGNFDCKELVQGSMVYLPVSVPGALFSLGDGHALQGDGEVAGVALECPMALVELSFGLLPELHLALPRAETPAGRITFGFHEDLLEASMLALDGMLDWMVERYGMSRKEALALSSLLVDLRITQVVNGVRGVHAMLKNDLSL